MHMQLPIQGTEWGEVVLFARSNPRQAIPAMHMSRVALAQRTIGIVNARLRDQPEYRMAGGREAQRHRENQRRDNSSCCFTADALGDQGREGTISGLNQRAGKA